MQPKVSIIVPIYNAEAFLPHCLEMLVHQTLAEIEIILVLDCPTDRSTEIAENYASRYPQIRLIRNAVNLHAGESRNRGIEAATGEYVGFVDADDFVELRMFEDMYLTAKERDADVVLINRVTCLPGQNELGALKDRTVLPVQESRDFLYTNLMAMIEGDYTLSFLLLYTHLYRREFLYTHTLRLKDSRIMMGEDLLFNLQVHCILLDENKKLVYLPQAYYHYLIREGSLCHSAAFYAFSMTIPLLEAMAFEVSRCISIPNKESDKVMGIRVARNLYGAFCNEVHLYGLQRAWKNLISSYRKDVIRFALRDGKPWCYRRLGLRKRVFSFLLTLILG